MFAARGEDSWEGSKDFSFLYLFAMVPHGIHMPPVEFEG
jgi:hypothetical protein